MSRRVLVEILIPTTLSEVAQLEVIHNETRGTGFVLDESYAPVPVPSTLNGLGDRTGPEKSRYLREVLAAGLHHVLLVRGAIEPEQESVLARRPHIVSIRLDPRIEPLE